MDGDAVIIIIIFGFILLFLVYVLYNKHIMKQMDKMLDEAIKGDYEPSSYTESQLSKMESKLGRFLKVNKLKRVQIEQEQNSVRTLISDISYQTKTPIANVLLYTELLREQRELSPKSQEMVEQIATGAENLNFLIQALIKTSRLESGILKVVPKKGMVDELIDGVIKQGKQGAELKDISIDFHKPSSPIYAMYDFKWCAEALYNILDNAIKYTPPKGMIKINIKPYEFFVQINISDTGKGIEKDEIPNMFSRFWRSADSAEVEGVGIGLYLTREIIEACGGYIKVQSKIGVGTSLSVFLPINQ